MVLVIMSFKVQDDSILVKYNDIWNKITMLFNIKSHCQPIYDEKCIKTKVKTFNGVVNTIFQTITFPKKIFITFVLQQINIDFVMKIEEKLSSAWFRRMQI